MGFCNRSLFCCTLLYVYSSIAIILVGKRVLAALLNLSFWCLVMVEWLFLAVPWGCLRFVIVVFPDRIHLLFLTNVHPDLFRMVINHIAPKLTVPTVIPFKEMEQIIVITGQQH